MNRRGTTLIDFVISMAIVVVLFTGVYLVYFSIVSAVENVDVRNAAVTVLDNQIEMIRDLPYVSVGTVGGLPSGILPQQEALSYGPYSFLLLTDVRNIDDPFDGTLGGNPNDTAPADYKIVSLQATCPTCQSFFPITITMTVAPKNLESATVNGSIFIYAIDANGDPVSGATVNVTNASVTPSISLTDTTNASGVLQLVGAPTSTQGYQISVTKSGYSTDETYPPGVAGNPNPVEPNITVAAQTLSNVTLAIDRLSQLTVQTVDDRCNAVPNEHFTIQGSKLIGTSPNVLKFATSSMTNASGTAAFPSVEWDTYTLGLSDAAEDVLGTIPLTPIVINPSSTVAFQFILQPAQDPSLLATVTDAATGAGIPNASVTIMKGSFSQALATDHAFISQNAWNDGQFSSQSGNMDTATPGALAIALNASGTYTTGTTNWLVSNTFDLGGTSSTLNALSWTPGSEPSSTGSGSVSFQVAANNDDATWNFVGPDGTSGSFFTASSTALPAILNGNRYVRYEVFMTTQDPATSPIVANVSLDFSANCVPPAQSFFSGLAQGTYTVTVNAAGYAMASTTVAVGSGEASTTLSLVAN